jgi:hypothetical protein
MSYDFALQRICSHEALFQTSSLDQSTYDTIRFAKPPSSSQVNLFVDGLQIPSSGFISIPKLPFSRSGPYTIRKDQSDLLCIKIGDGAIRFIQVISGFSVSAKDLAKDISNKIPELNVGVENDHVIFTAKNPTIRVAFSFPDPRWIDRTESLPETARILGFFKQVGIIPGRSVVGYRLFPGWSLVQDPSVNFGEETIIKLNYPIPNENPVILLSYVTSAADCRRCGGIRIEFDYNVVSNTYEIVQNTDLLAQEADKFIFTKLGSHFKWNWLGSNLIDRIGSKNTGPGASASITTDITQAFRTYQNIKSQQDSLVSQQISDAEFPYALTNIDVTIPDDDPTVAIVNFEITSRSRSPIELTRVVGNPSPFTLSGNPIEFLLRG